MSFTFLHQRSLFLLRIAFGIVFLWSGILQLFNAHPLQEVTPIIKDSQLLLFLGACLSIAIGVAYIINKYVRISTIAMICMTAILNASVLFSNGFDPRFPLLSFSGAYALQGLIIIVAGLVLLSEKEETYKHDKKED